MCVCLTEDGGGHGMTEKCVCLTEDGGGHVMTEKCVFEKMEVDMG